MRIQSLDDLFPKTLLESSITRVKLGYAKHLMECVSHRTFLESSALVASTLGRMADKVLMNLDKEDKGDPIRFNALSTFDDKISQIKNKLYDIITDKSADSSDYQYLARLYNNASFLANPSEDGILRKALNDARRSSGNRLANFIRNIIIPISEKNTSSPIEAFKKEVNTLKSEISKFYTSDFPFSATLAPYKEHLLGSEDGLIEILDSISDYLLQNVSDIQAINANVPKKFSQADNLNLDGILTGHQTNHLYEAECAFMEGLAESLKYFSR